MSNYRRAREPGASYFFTVVTYGRRPVFEDPVAVNALRTAMRQTMRRRPFVIDAIVVLPDHLHAIWTLPEGDADYSTRWSIIKRSVSLQLPHASRPPSTPSRTRRRERTLWQRRYWEHLIRDEDDLRRHVDYVHYNPVRHGLGASPAEWPHGSFRRAVARGLYPVGWGRCEPASVGGMMLE
ncbi:MAG: transposase [Ectothiorhodospiraceae bacterium]|nr:transposase [Ectothiorhodospiraceae bacterium]